MSCLQIPDSNTHGGKAVSGRKEKAQRAAEGRSIELRRSHRAFEQDVRRIIEERDTRATGRRRTKRQVFALVALVCCVLVGAGLIGLAIWGGR